MSHGRMSGKRALVTAAGQGIGRAVALALLAEGAEIVATDRDATLLDGFPAAVETTPMDVTDRDAVQRTVASGEAFDAVVNCAGFVHAGTILDCDDDDWRRSFAINVDGMYHVCRSALPAMLAQGGGSIVNIASVASSIRGVPNRFVYGTTKAAVIGLSKAIAADFVKQGVRCNAICPGTIRSPSLEQRVAALGGDQDAHWQAFTDRQPMGRLGTPEEVAALAVYLASDASAFTTGAIHVIDGGWTN
jgi:2-keto-3-deoxy-L-fuconate dehydrogenase